MSPKLVFKHILTSLCLAAGILAIANVDSLLEEDDHAKQLTRARVKIARARLVRRLERSQEKIEAQGKGGVLRDSLAQDEFGELTPFAGLSTLYPLTHVIAKGIKSFERTTYRSPEYQGESGYDLVHYEIEHPDGEQSSIVAYLDRTLATAARNVGAPDPRVPVVMILEGRGEQSAYSLYRSGDLIEQTEIPVADSQDLVARRISASVPFMSVSR